VFAPQSQLREVERFRAAHRRIISTFWNQFVSVLPRMVSRASAPQSEFLEGRVVRPLQQLTDSFHRSGSVFLQWA
jgi:hypothetical protein